MIIDPQNINLIAFGVAFAAGLLSFLSPCVLPLVPAYIGYLSGATVAGGEISVDSRRITFTHAVAFVLGFSVLFVFLEAWLGLAGYVVQLFSDDTGAAITGLGMTVEELLTRVGTVLLGIMAVRVADNTMSSEWRFRFGRTVVVWPGRTSGIPQKFVRWAIVGVIFALVHYWLANVMKPGEVVLVDTLMIGLLPLAGAGLSERGALLLGIVVAGVNTFSRFVDPISDYYTVVDWIGVALQATLIFLVVYFVSRTTLFYQEKRFEVSGPLKNRGYLTSGVMGAVFGAGWTPCTGPNLAVIVALAASASNVGVGAALLGTYSLGLGVPFLLVGLAFGAATAALRRIMPYMTVVKAVNTALLLFMAALILSGRLQTLADFGGFSEGVFGINL